MYLLINIINETIVIKQECKFSDDFFCSVWLKSVSNGMKLASFI